MKFTMIRRITALVLILVLAAGISIQASSASTEKVTEDAASTKSLLSLIHISEPTRRS